MESANAIHDRRQFESKFDFPLDPVRTPDERYAYELDVYFFVPRSMGAPADIYPKDRFFASLTHYLRIHAPDTVIPRLDDARAWTLPSADEYLAAHLTHLKRQHLGSLVVQDVRLFACSIFSHYKRTAVRLEQALAKNDAAAREKAIDSVLESLAQLDTIVGTYRTHYVQRVRGEMLMLDEEVKRAFLLVDEYVSYGRESALVRVLKRLQPMRSAPETDLSAVLHREIAYRREHIEFSRVSREQEKARETAERENHYYRLGLLKKYVSSVLFVSSSAISRDKVYRNAIGMVGAFLAATFATLAQLQMVKMVNDQATFSPRLAFVLFLGIIAYVFKDRIKELSKEYFNERLKHKIPDVEAELKYHYVAPDGSRQSEAIGLSTEFLRYLGRGAVPSDVSYVREIGHNAELEPDRQESAIHFSKRINLSPDAGRMGVVKRVHEVLRFDVSEFLGKLSDPNKPLSFFDPEQGVKTIEAPKVYHVNLVFRYKRVTTNAKGRVLRSTVEIERVRLVLNKKRIVRIEQVVPRGELGYSEDAA